MMERIWEALEQLSQSTGIAVENLYALLEQQAKGCGMPQFVMGLQQAKKILNKEVEKEN